MTLTPTLRKVALTTHIAVSVGWFGAVAAFLALSIAGLVSRDAETVRSAYVAMNVIGLSIIIPLSFASLTTGLIEALGSQWGLVRHYWVVSKALLTVLAAGLVLLHQYSAVAEAAKRVLGAAAGALPSAGRFGTQLVVDSSLAVLALLTTTTLAVYKPRGLTHHGWRKQRGRTGTQGIGIEATRDGPSLGLRTLLAVVAGIVATFAVVHITGLAGHHRP